MAQQAREAESNSRDMGSDSDMEILAYIPARRRTITPNSQAQVTQSQVRTTENAERQNKMKIPSPSTSTKNQTRSSCSNSSQRVPSSNKSQLFQVTMPRDPCPNPINPRQSALPVYSTRPTESTS